jgi:YbbR domain-containing protein
MSINVGQLITRNWPVKLAALFFALMLYVAVAAQQPITQLFTLELEVIAPPGRSIKQAPTQISVLLSGRGGELLKVRSLPRVISKTVPDTFAGSHWHIRLQASDVPVPKGVDVQVADMAPRDVDVALDSAARREVRIVPQVTLNADSSLVLQGVTVRPATAHVVGPPKSLTGIDSLLTAPLTVAGVAGPFSRSVALDTGSLGAARVVPTDVQISGDVAAVLQRSFPGVAVTTAASGFAGFTLARERVVVQAYGPASRIEALTRDSLRVIAHLVGHAGPDAYARLTVASPPGITARAVPDSVALKPIKPATPVKRPTPVKPVKQPIKHKGGRG